MNTEPVRSWMTKWLITITPQTTLPEAARLMVEHKIGGLPVVESGKLIGIITETDLCRVLMSQPETVEPATWR